MRLLSVIGLLIASLSLLSSPVQSDQADQPVYHIIAHSHCDPGWLNTFEGYYLQEVKRVLDSVLVALDQSVERKFVWSESSFFARWWETLSLSQRATFKKIFKNGQFEFVNGGWAQNDEANPDPLSIINQMTEGHTYLLHEFGVVPRVAWQIDPFGHSAVTPAIFRLMGFQALVINRIHHKIKDYFKETKHMEFLWKGDDLGESHDLSNEQSTDQTTMFTHVLHTHYSAPQGFDWEEGSQMIDDRNVANRARQLINTLQQRATAYRHNHLLVPFGDDFKFKNAELQFSNMGQLIKYVNDHPDEFHCTLKFSTLSEYFAGASQSGQFPTMQGDFMPYADNEQSYWTGYYTTRPLLKHLSRTLGAQLRSAEILHTLLRVHPGSMLDSRGELLPADYWERQFSAIALARQETGLFLHHDAITGTARSHVVNDYIDRMQRASRQINELMADMMQHATTRDGKFSPLLTTDAHILDIGNPQQTHSQSATLTAKFAPVVVFNSLAWNRRSLMEVRVSSRHARVLDSNGNAVECQVDAAFDDLHSAVPANSQFILSWIADLPPLGATTFFVSMAPNDQSIKESNKAAVTQSVTHILTQDNRAGKSQEAIQSRYIEYGDLSEPIVISNSKLKATFSSSTGLLSKLETLNQANNVAVDITQKFSFYRTSQSGAYLFRPSPEELVNLFGDQMPEGGIIRVVDGPVVSRISLLHHKFAVSWTLLKDESTDQSINELLNNQLIMEFESFAEHNQEIMLVTSTNLVNQNQFYTHDGLTFARRAKNGGPLPGQFYPMNAGLRVQDEERNEKGETASSLITENTVHRRLSILTSRTVAASVPNEGQIQMLVHRRLGQDDGRGLAEPVNDDSHAPMTLYFSLDSFDARADQLIETPIIFDDEEQFTRRMLLVQHPILKFYLKMRADAAAEADEAIDPKSRYVSLFDSIDDWSNNQLTQFEPMAKSFPINLHLHSLTARDAVSDNVGIRLQHIGQIKQSNSQDQMITVDLREYFSSSLFVAELRRVGLSFNHRLPWRGLGVGHSHASSNKQSVASLSVPSNVDDADSLHPGWLFKADAETNVLDTLRLRPFLLNRNSFHKSGDNQNTEEEGVFISEAALRLEKEKAQAANRALLSIDQSINQSINQTNRHLLSVSEFAPISVPLIEIRPRQLQSYLMHLAVDDMANWAKYDAQHGQPDLPDKISTRKSHHNEPKSEPIPAHKVESPQVQNHVRDNPNDVIVPPAPMSDNPALPPSIFNDDTMTGSQTSAGFRWEYLLILVISLIAVSFFAVALGIVPGNWFRRGASRSSPGAPLMRGQKASGLQRIAYTFDAWSSRVWHRARAILLRLRYRTSVSRQPSTSV